MAIAWRVRRDSARGGGFASAFVAGRARSPFPPASRARYLSITMRIARVLAPIVLTLLACGGPPGAADPSGHRVAGGAPRYDGPLPTSPVRGAARLVVQVGHEKGVAEARLSPDGKVVATASYDHTVRLWSVSTGFLLRTLTGHPKNANYARFTSDGREVVTVGWSAHVKVFDTSTGALVRDLPPFQTNSYRELNGMDMTPDGKTLVVGANDGTVWVVDGQTGGARGYPMHGTGDPKNNGFFRDKSYVHSVSVSPDGALAATVGADWHDFKSSLSIKLFRTATGEVLDTIRAPALEVGAALLTRDGRRLVYGFGKELRFYNLVAGLDIEKLATPFSVRELRELADGRIAVLGPDGELATRAPAKDLEVVRDGATKVLVRDLSGDGRTLLYTPAGDRDGGPEAIVAWDTERKGTIATLAGATPTLQDASFTPDGKAAITLLAGGELGHWDLSGARLDTSHKAEPPFTSAVLLPDGQRALVGRQDDAGGLALWDLARDREVSKLPSKQLLGFVPGGALAIVQGESICHDPPDDGRFHGHAWKVLECQYPLAVADVAAGKLLRTFTEGHSSNVARVGVSRDGALVLTGSYDRTMELREVATGALKKKMSVQDLVFAVALSPDGSRALVGGQRPWTTVDVYDTASGHSLHKMAGHSYDVTALAVSPDGRLGASGSGDSTVRIWDLATGKERRVLRGHGGTVRAVAFTPDGRRVLSAATDSTVKLWSLSSDDVLTLVSSGGEWVAFTQDGFFDASRRGGHLVAMVDGGRAFGIEQFAIYNNRPDIILQRFGLGSPEAISAYEGAVRRRIGGAGLTRGDLTSDLHVPEARIVKSEQAGSKLKLTIDLSDERVDLTRYSVFVNNVPLFTGGKPVKGLRRTRVEEVVELGAGRNVVEVSATNARGAESYRALATVEGPPRPKGRLHFVAFGVSRYKDPALNLGLAHKDAQDLARALAAQRGEYAEVRTHVFTNEEVTVERVRTAKQLLTGATLDDTLVVFLAGHGVHGRDAAGTYYYATHDVDPKRLADTAAPFALIEALFEGIAPRKKVLLLDTCESGAADEEGAVATAPGARGLRPRTTRALVLDESPRGARRHVFDRDRFVFYDLQRRTGTLVFASSRGSEASYEDPAVGNGLFTAKLLEALTTANGDSDRDGRVSLTELSRFVSQGVATLSGGRQHPTIDVDNPALRLELAAGRR